MSLDYGFYLNPLRPSKTSIGLDKFYDECQTPLVTTFHISMNFKQWMKLINIKERGNDKDFPPFHVFTNTGDILLIFSMHRINKDLMSKRSYGIVFSNL